MYSRVYGIIAIITIYLDIEVISICSLFFMVLESIGYEFRCHHSCQSVCDILKVCMWYVYKHTMDTRYLVGTT